MIQLLTNPPDDYDKRPVLYHPQLGLWMYEDEAPWSRRSGHEADQPLEDEDA